MTIVIITHNNYSYKNGCIESVIYSLLNQVGIHFEIVVVDNCSNEDNYLMLQQFIDSLNVSFSIKLIRNSVNNISKGRNLGIQNATTDLIVFMDDDIVLIEKDTLGRVKLLSNKYSYGYSAIRLWTPENWYESNKDGLELRLTQNEENYEIQTVVPEPSVREKKINRHLIRTYIGNFGFAHKEVLVQVGFWDEFYTGYGIEDDTMALKLFIQYGRPALLNNISVVHIWHKISKDNYNQLSENKTIFDQILRKNGIKCFHVGRLLYDEDHVIDYLDENRNCFD